MSGEFRASRRQAASRHARTPEQTSFRYLTQCDVVPLTGTRSERHMREDLAILEFELDRDEQQRITALLDASRSRAEPRPVRSTLPGPCGPAD